VPEGGWGQPAHPGSACGTIFTPEIEGRPFSHRKSLRKAERLESSSGRGLGTLRRRKWGAGQESQGPTDGQLPVLFTPTLLLQPASPRARQELSQGHTWGDLAAHLQ
jgi:hypothetical protein